MQLIGWVIERALVGACMFACVNFFLSLAVLVRLLPVILRGLYWALRGLLILSFRFYYLVLSRLAPVAGRWLGINVLDGFPRMAATVLLSVLLGLGLLSLTGAAITIWKVLLFGIHGLFVGLAWDDIQQPGGLQLGARVP